MQVAIASDEASFGLEKLKIKLFKALALPFGNITAVSVTGTQEFAFYVGK